MRHEFRLKALSCCALRNEIARLTTWWAEESTRIVTCVSTAMTPGSGLSSSELFRIIPRPVPFWCHIILNQQQNTRLSIECNRAIHQIIHRCYKHLLEVKEVRNRITSVILAIYSCNHARITVASARCVRLLPGLSFSFLQFLKLPLPIISEVFKCSNKLVLEWRDLRFNMVTTE